MNRQQSFAACCVHVLLGLFGRETAVLCPRCWLLCSTDPSETKKVTGTEITLALKGAGDALVIEYNWEVIAWKWIFPVSIF